MIGKIILVLSVVAVTAVTDMLVVKVCVKNTVKALKVSVEQTNS